ncbi:MAG TPA: nucleotidyltransferase domain-containing protein [Thermoanaerobaculia bacterium]
MDTKDTVIVRRIDEIAATVRRISEIESAGKILAVFLYGSVLSRLFRSDSDLDIAVLDCPESPLDWSAQAKLMDRLERETGHGVDLRMLRESSLSHQAHVIDEGRLVWTSDPAEVERYVRETLAAARQGRAGSESRWSQTLDRLARTAAAR